MTHYSVGRLATLRVDELVALSPVSTFGQSESESENWTFSLEDSFLSTHAGTAVLVGWLLSELMNW